MIVVLTTAPSREVAERLAELVVGERLAACVQVLPEMTSIYFWEGSLQKEHEHLLLIKTLETKFDKLSDFIHENHEYDVPEIVAVQAKDISEDYSNWLAGYLK
jgi:periplasmic divalent cation tolerance protein